MKKYGKRLNLDTIKVDVVDTAPDSLYFGVSEVSTIFTSGKNSISINGSPLLRPGTDVYVEILDYLNNPIYVEVGRSYGKTVYRDGVSIVFSASVYSDTPRGTGTIYIVGYDVSGRVVRWSKKIEINPSLQNISKVRFYNKPTFTIEPFINVTSQHPTASTSGIVSSGSFFGTPLNPPANSRIDYFDSTRGQLTYQLNWLSGTKFSSSMVGSTINFGTGLTSKISSVKNSSIALIQDPFLSNNLVVSTSSTYEISHIPYRDYEGETTKRIGTAEVIFKNIETFTGNVYRYKIFRSSLNAPYDSELVSDGTFYGNEILNDSESPRRATSDLGVVYAQEQIDKYWQANSISTTIVPDLDVLIDSMKIVGFTSDPNTDKSKYVMAALALTGSDYIPYSEPDFSSYDSRTNPSSSYKTNFIRLYKGVDYEMSMDLIGEKSSDVDSSVSFYITSSMSSIMSHKNYDGYGLNIGTFEYKASESYSGRKKFFGTVKSTFTMNSDVNGTLIIVPSNGDYTISNISIKPYTDFSLNPQTFTIRIPFDAKTENEGFRITCELFDINQTSVYRDLTSIKFFDPTGQTYPYNYLYSLISGSYDTSTNAFNTAVNVGNALALLSASYLIDSSSFDIRINSNSSSISNVSNRVGYFEGFITTQSLNLTNGTSSWGISVSGSNLFIDRTGGTGLVDIGNGTGVKIFGQQVTTGSNNSGGTGYTLLRIPN